MVRMKLSKEEFDPKALDVKVEQSTFKRYTGEIPRNGTILIARVTKMWWTQSKAGDPQIYLMAFAEQNTGELKQFNGLPIRERLTFIPDAAFRYMNFLNNFGLTTRDIYNKMDVEPEPDQIGDIINSIGDWVVGSDDALCRIALVRDRYDPDELKAKPDKEGWLPFDDEDKLADDIDDDDDDDDDDEPRARPTRGRSHTNQAPARGGKAASGRSRDVPEDDDDDDDDEYDDDEEDDGEEDEEADEEEQDDEGEGDGKEESSTSTSRRSRNAGRTTTRTRPTETGRRGAATSGRRNGESTRSGARASTARTSRATGAKGSTGRDGGSRQDPPF